MKNVIGENIKRLRKQQEIKQAVLAAKLNIGRQTLSAYERGVTLPDVLALIEIADYFGVSLDELTSRMKKNNSIYWTYLYKMYIVDISDIYYPLLWKGGGK